VRRSGSIARCNPIYLLSNIPGHSDLNNGPAFLAKAVQEWITAIGAMESMKKRRPALPATLPPAQALD